MKNRQRPHSIYLNRVCTILILFASCKKSTDLPSANPSTEDLAKAYVGTYHVTEDASVFYPAGPHTQSEFTGQIVRDHSILSFPVSSDGYLFTDTINVIAFVQSGRNPAPAWAVEGRDIAYGSDTITFKVFKSAIDVSKDTIVGVYGGLAEVRVLGKDSLSYSYMYGAGSIAYVVNQTWVKK